MSRSDRRNALRRAAPLVGIVAGAVLAVLVAGGPGRDGPPLDPSSTGPRGTKALVEVLSALGIDVALTDAPGAGDAVALLLADALDDHAAEDVREWVRAGGTLVVADPASTFVPEVVGAASVGPLETSLPRACAADALSDVARVAAPGGVVYAEPDAGALACFPRGDGYWLVATPSGEGTVVALGGPGAFTNRALGEADNGLLVAALLAPEVGGSVAFLRPAAPGTGQTGLRDLVADRVWLALLQLGLAFLVVVAWRSRRLGAPVAEPQPVQIAGSELVTAVGHLLQQTGARAQAARVLRDDLRRELADRLGLPADSPVQEVTAAWSRRTGQHPDELADLLCGPDPAGEGDLVALAVDLERARRGALADPTPTKEPLHAR